MTGDPGEQTTKTQREQITSQLSLVSKALILVGTGSWLLTSAFLPMTSTEVLATFVGAGALQVLAGTFLRKERVVQGWGAILVGLWLAVGALAPEILERNTRHWNSICTGMLTTVFGITALGGRNSLSRSVFRQSESSALRQIH